MYNNEVKFIMPNEAIFDLKSGQRVVQVCSNNKVNKNIEERGTQMIFNEGFKYNDLYETLKEQYDNMEQKEGIRIGIKKLDKDTGGFHFGTTNTIMGFTGSGKSTFALNIAYNALVQGYNVCYISLELSAKHVLYNLLSRHSIENKVQIAHKYMKDHTLTKEEYISVFSEVLPSFRKLPGKIYIADEQFIGTKSISNFREMLTYLNDLCIKEKGKGLDLIIVDHIQLLKYDADNTKSDGYAVMNEYVSFFRQQSLNLLGTGRNCCLLLVSQANRTGFNKINNSRKEKSYTLSDVAEANEIERASNMVIALIKEDENANGMNEIKYQLIKSRESMTMTAPETTYFDPKYYFIGSVTSYDDKYNTYKGGIEELGLNNVSKSEFSVRTITDFSNLDIEEEVKNKKNQKNEKEIKKHETNDEEAEFLKLLNSVI